MNIARLGLNLSLSATRSFVLRRCMLTQPKSSIAVLAGQQRSYQMSSSNLNNLNRTKRRGLAGVAQPQTDRELNEYLAGEIQSEKQLIKLPRHGPGVPGFDVSTNGSTVKLVRKLNDETITVKFNVNGTVDSEDDVEEFEGQPPSQQQNQQTEMKSRPDFLVEISKPNGRILAFACRLYGEQSFEAEGEQADDKGDKFEIESFAVLNKEDLDEFGDWDESVYMADGGIADGQLYDLLMNYLDERGLGSEFADNLMDYSTHYEHNQYVQLLEKMRSYIEGK